MLIPLAESFHSLQGEGTWVGTPMHFIRLAGCSVGKYVDPNSSLRGSLPDPPELPSGKPAWLCHDSQNRPFWCDTDFNKRMDIDLYELLNETREKHVCLTGGEPLIHREAVDKIREWCYIHGKRLHIETSGTIDYWWEEEEMGTPDEPWVTVSPKNGIGTPNGCTPYMLNRADEIKILVDKNFDLAKVDPAVVSHGNVFISPINYVSVVDSVSLEKAMQVLYSMPGWRLSVQLHKYLGLR